MFTPIKPTVSPETITKVTRLVGLRCGSVLSGG